jgi:hypothetical protein
MSHILCLLIFLDIFAFLVVLLFFSYDLSPLVQDEVLCAS